jgi:endonuclease/exonuclease/phosphatase (EEP) superfamily protein YafD
MLRPSGRRAVALAMLGMIAALVAAALIARAQPVTNMPRLVLAVGAPYVALAAAIVVAVALWRRRSVVAVGTAALVTAVLAQQVSWYYLGRPSDVGPHAEVRVMAANINRGQADASSFVEIAEHSADVITVAELTPEAVARFAQAGINDAFRHLHLIPAPDAGGIGIWSRYPLRVLSAPRHRGALLPAAQVRIPGVRFDPVLAGVHVFSPVADRMNNIEGWRNEMAGAQAQLDNLAAAAGPGAVIVGGDYNSTPDVRQFRDLLTDGYRDAVDQAGSGFAPTFPSDTRYPPVITIDHVLVRNATAASAHTADIRGSDHRAVLVTVRVPLEPGSQ